MLLDKVGLQLYSLRDETAKDFPGTLTKVAAMGYKAVEFAGYGGMKPSELSTLLKELGLTAYGSHVGSEKLEKTLDQEIEMNAALGSRYIVCPYAPIKTRDDTLRLADFLNKCNEKVHAAGMNLGYHNHAHEFENDGGEYLLDILFKNVELSVFAEVDVFWVAYAGVDPVEYIAKYPNRQPLIHLKELASNGKDNVEIGTGTLDFGTIIRTAQSLGTKSFIVEQEEYTMPPLESCKVSLDALLMLQGVGTLKTLRTGVVGLGFIGRQHIEALRRLPSAQLVAVCDQDESVSRALAEKWGVRAYSSWKKMIDSGEIDVIHNCTPNSLHDEINGYAIEKRLNVYSEKPLSMSSTGALRLAGYAKEMGVLAAVNYNYRHNVMAHEMRERLHSAGRPLIVRGEYLQDWLLKDTDFNWRVETRDGQSRAVADIGTHWMDLAQWMLGQPIVAVRASLGIAHPTRVAPGGRRVPVHTEDFGFLEFRFRDRIPAFLVISQVSSGCKNGLSISVDCEDASYEWHQEEADRLRINRRGGHEMLYADSAILSEDARSFATLPAGHAVAWADALRNAIGLYYQSILDGSFCTGHPDWATFDDGGYQMRLIEAALQSDKSGLWVELIP